MVISFDKLNNRYIMVVVVGFMKTEQEIKKICWHCDGYGLERDKCGFADKDTLCFVCLGKGWVLDG